MLSSVQKIAFTYAKTGEIPKLLALIDKNIDLLTTRNEHDNTLLLFALKHNQQDIAKAIIDKGADVNVFNKKGMTPLLYALKKHYFDFANALLTKNNSTNVNSINHEQTSPLMLAAQSGDLNIINCLLSNHAAINYKDNAGLDAFMFASLYQHQAICIRLLTSGAHINSQDSALETALHKAVLLDHTEWVDFLLTQGASITITNDTGESPLDIAANAGNITIISKLLEKEDSRLYSLFFWAIENNFIPLVEALLEKESLLPELPFHLSALRSDEMEPVIATAIPVSEPFENSKHDELYPEGAIPLLSEIQAPSAPPLLLEETNESLINMQNENGETPLTFAVKQDLPNMVDFLIKKGANVKLINQEGDSALWLAFSGSKLNCANIFYQHCRLSGNRINQEGFNERATKTLCDIEAHHYIENPLIEAVKSNHFDLVETLIKKGADINDYDRRGNSALILSVMLGFTLLTKYLLSNNASINQQNNNGWTPLMWATYKSNEPLIKILIQAKSTLTITNNENKTALDIALEKNDIDPIFTLYKAMRYLGLNVQNHYRLTPLKQENTFEMGLIKAIEEEDFSLIEYLLHEGANIEGLDENNHTPMMVACRLGKVLVMKYLKEKGALFEMPPPNKCPLIYLAIECDQKDVINFLIEEGMSIHERFLEPISKNEMLPIHFAVLSKSHKALQCLLSHDPALSQQIDRKSQSPLHLAAKNNDVNACRILLADHAKLNEVDYLGRLPIALSLNDTGYQTAAFLYTEMVKQGFKLPVLSTEKQKIILNQIIKENDVNNVLMSAINKDDLIELKACIQNGSNVNACTAENKTPLMQALENNNLQMADELLVQGADIETITKNETLLMKFALKGEHKHVAYLLSKGASPLTTNPHGISALMFAVSGAHLNCVKLLVEHSPTMIDKKNINGWTALSMSITQSKKDISSYLKSNGASTDIKNKLGQTLLMVFCHEGDLDLAKEQILEGHELTAIDPHNRTALHYACDKKHREIIKTLVIAMQNKNINLPADLPLVREIEKDILAFKQYCMVQYRLKRPFDFINHYSQIEFPNTCLNETDKEILFNDMAKRLDIIFALRTPLINQINSDLIKLGAENRISIQILFALDSIIIDMEQTKEEITHKKVDIQLMQNVRNKTSNLMKAIGGPERMTFFSPYPPRKRTESLGHIVTNSTSRRHGAAAAAAEELEWDFLPFERESKEDSKTEECKIEELKERLKLNFELEEHRQYWSDRVNGPGGELCEGNRVPKTISKLITLISSQKEPNYDKLLTDLKDTLRQEKLKNNRSPFTNFTRTRSPEVSKLIQYCESLELILFNDFNNNRTRCATY